MNQLIGFLVLPGEISAFEQSYLRRVNRIALWFFVAHLPVLPLIAWINDTRPWVAAALTACVLVGPVVAYRALSSPRHVSMLFGVTAMIMGGLLVHFGQGPLQIEMHFYFFSLLAMCAVFGNPMVIVAATVTVALHHLLVWLALPRSVFNYDAAWWVVAVHAAFVVLESVATCFIARSFFDNVIGLERIVESRTHALDQRNRDLRLVLDNMRQGFLTIDPKGVMSAERSAAVERWLGKPAPGASWFDLLEAASPAFGKSSRRTWDLIDGMVPAEIMVAQLPARLALADRVLRVEYAPIGAAEPPERYLVIVSDVTDEEEREKAEADRGESMALFERLLADRTVFDAFFEEAGATVTAVGAAALDLPATRSALHTLKGNAGIFGLASIAHACHDLEQVIEETGEVPSAKAATALVERWTKVSGDMARLLGSSGAKIEMDEAQYRSLLSAASRPEAHALLMARLRGLKLEPTRGRLKHFASHARALAERLEKGLEVVVEDNDVRLDSRRWSPFWSAVVHAVRNAVDHGIESPEERVAAGKPMEGKLVLRTLARDGRIFVEIHDDGRGIDWDRIAARAADKGLPCKTPAELQRALFSDGITTKDDVTELSGRGVGMGALLQSTVDLGGDLSVESTVGAGTLLRMSFAARLSMLPMSDGADQSAA